MINAAAPAAAEPSPDAPAAPAATLRAYRFCLDPTPLQQTHLAQHAGAARWAFNHALSAKVDAHRRWREQVDALVDAGTEPAAARKQVKVPIPSKVAIQKALNQVKGDDRTGVDGACPWWHTVSTYAFQSAFIDADNAWGNWLSSHAKTRAGRRVGYPRFKKKGRGRDSFRIHHDTRRPTIRPDGYRRLQIPRLGSIRLHDSAKRLTRALTAGATIQSVTVSRQAHRWYAAVLVKLPEHTTPAPPTRRQRAAGRVGVVIGGRHLAVLSTGDTVANPRHLDRDLTRLANAQRKLARTRKGSNRRARAALAVGKIHHRVAQRRATTLHQLTRRLATSWAEVALQDLQINTLTESEPRRRRRGLRPRPAAVTAELNRTLLDLAPGTLRRQLEYKTTWYGSVLLLAPRGTSAHSTCSHCGQAKATHTAAQHVSHCNNCRATLDRDINAARTIAAAALPADRARPQNTTVASDRGETQNARREHVPRGAPTGTAASSTKREDPRGHPG